MSTLLETKHIVSLLLITGSIFIVYYATKKKKVAEPKVVKQQPSTTKKESSKKSKNNSNKKQSSTFTRVFVRIRPLIKEEIENKDEKIEYNIKKAKKGQTLNITNIQEHNKTISKSWKNFGYIFTEINTNETIFEKCILPYIDPIFNNNNICVFAYGHTGSGKTHTMLGYNNKSIGIYELTARYIFDRLKKVDINGEIMIKVNFYELYLKKWRDLLNNKKELILREDEKKEVFMFRGDTVKDDQGRVMVMPPGSLICRNADQIIEGVTNALKLRNVGSSTLHDESSRSHAFLEFELVTQQLLDARDKVLQSKADEVPTGKALDDESIAMEGHRWIQDKKTGQYRERSNFSWDMSKLKELTAELQKLENITKEYKNNVNNILNNNKLIGGKIMFVDLAGNEYGVDAKKEKKKQSDERNSINLDLSSLKGVFVAKNKNSKHVPYRQSEMTKALKIHLQGVQSKAIMISNVSSSLAHINKTKKTLKYAALVAEH